MYFLSNKQIYFKQTVNRANADKDIEVAIAWINKRSSSIFNGKGQFPFNSGFKTKNY